MKRKGSSLAIPSVLLFSLQQKAVSIRAMQSLCTEFGSKSFTQCQHLQGLASLQAKALPLVGLKLAWVTLCLPLHPLALSRVLLSVMSLIWSLCSELGSAAYIPLTVDPEVTAIQQKCIPLAALFLTYEGALQFEHICSIPWFTSSFCLPPPVCQTF